MRIRRQFRWPDDLALNQILLVLDPGFKCLLALLFGVEIPVQRVSVGCKPLPDQTVRVAKRITKPLNIVTYILWPDNHDHFRNKVDRCSAWSGKVDLLSSKKF